tara:strand:- start:161 stop:286 length:126 start_codon:yes stop_codon:yes gene_type:complete
MKKAGDAKDSRLLKREVALRKNLKKRKKFKEKNKKNERTFR